MENDEIVVLETKSFEDVGLELGLTTDEVVAAVLKAQLGDGVTNVTYSGSAAAGFVVSEFDIPGQIDLDCGFLLSSGVFKGNSNTDSGFSVENITAGDDDLSATALAAFGGSGSTNDASTIEFNLDVTDSSISGLSFDLVFGSEEYPEFSNSSFVDVAAIYVNGQNVALFNDDPSTPLSVIDNNLVNGNFIDNTSGIYATEWDGFSQVLSIRANLQQGSNTIKIGVADTGDFILDSGLYVTNLDYIGGGATGGGVLIVVDGTTSDDDLTVGLSAQEINLFTGTDTVTGTPESLDGDVITNFGTDDTIVVQNSVFTTGDITVTFGSAILDIDTDQDGVSDTTISLEGDFTGAQFVATQLAGDTQITFVIDEEEPPIDDEEPPSPEFNSLVGTEKRDLLGGGNSADKIEGLGGNDNLLGRGGDDLLEGGDGTDFLRGGQGDDTLIGGDGPDLIYGGQGDDLFIAGKGKFDQFVGGNGFDTFVFSGEVATDADRDKHVIQSYRTGEDVIDLNGAVISSVETTNFQVKLNLAGGDDQISVFGVTSLEEITFADPLVIG